MMIVCVESSGDHRRW